ncbi:(Fe-S)-binding protein [Methanosarcina sp. KYL-1]|uniref:4Fe-4S binding protein n=1 Tax=Methanosarcina sp. KYL-1 TaxID=2602068 RepID=UPI002100965F|nr:4Fe-4S dicluster domain-containing protein [Methanosarcina sp. KYL-1]MCQ1536795.1 (Fe-S)-binding protein [Methanosarcina sp. KYL-1]
MAKRLKVANPARCIGCYSCMRACARTWYNTISLKNSRINIQTKGGIETPYAQIVCHACVDPPCMRACPIGALTKRKGGGVNFNREICDGCGKCVEACLMGAIHLDVENKAVICKHCGVCTKFCPHDVLEMIEVEDSGEVKVTDTGPVSPTESHKELYGKKEAEEGESGKEKAEEGESGKEEAEEENEKKKAERGSGKKEAEEVK